MSRKKGNGMGTVYRRKDGTYCVQRTIGGHRVTAYGRNKTEALAKMNKKLISYQYTYKDKSSVTMSEYIEIYKRTLPEVKRTTELTRDYVFERINDLLGNIIISKISDDIIVKFVSDLSRKYSGHTIKIIVSRVFAILDHARRHGYNIKATCTTRDVFHQKKRIKKLPSIEDALAVISDIHNFIFQCCGYIALYSGLRRGEVCGLQWSDIDMSTGIIRVNRQIVIAGDGTKLITTPKNGIAGQTVQLMDAGASKLQELSTYYKKNGINSDFVFVFHDKPVNPISLGMAFRQSFLAHGIHGCSFHVFRHLHASLLANNNIPLITIASQLRHSKPSTTDRYLHSITDTFREDIKRIEITPLQ